MITFGIAMALSVLFMLWMMVGAVLTAWAYQCGRNNRSLLPDLPRNPFRKADPKPEQAPERPTPRVGI